MINTDDKYMAIALKTALCACGKTSPNPIVGAVIVKKNRVVSKGYHKRCGGPHAEINALDAAGTLARGATLYLTLEPCFHYGRTPPCVDRIIATGIKKVVIAMKDPNPRTNGRSIAKLRRNNITVVAGVMKKQAEGINQPFIKAVTKGIPYVVTKTAQTLDGKIATSSGHSKWITSETSREYGRKLRDRYDAVLVGSTTVLADNPQLNGFAKGAKTKKVILDSKLRIPPTAKIFKSSVPSSIFIATSAAAPTKKIESLKEKGINVIICPNKQGVLNVRWLCRRLVRCGINSVFIEGGAKVIGSALKEKLVDKMYVFIAPKIVGDAQALSSISGMKVRTITQALTFKEYTVVRQQPDILIEGIINRY